MENTGNFEILPKQGFWHSQVVSSLILKINDIVYDDSCRKHFQIFSQKLDMCAKSVLYMKSVINHRNWHRENVWLDREKQEICKQNLSGDPVSVLIYFVLKRSYFTLGLLFAYIVCYDA